MKSQVYWQKRFETLEASQINKGVEYYDRLSEKYRQAISETEKEISKWYTRYAANNQITLTEAQKRLNSKELAEFHMDVKEYIKKGHTLNYSDTWAKQLESASTKYHVSRLEALKVQMQQQAEAVFGNETDDISNLATNIYTDGYYHTAYEVQKGIGVGTDFAKLDANKVNLFINKPWAADGKNFSARIWSNRQKLVNELDTKLTQCIIQGKSPQSVISEISKRFEVSKSQAGNLVMTECAFFSSAAQKDSFTALDVEEFEIVATLDNHTSLICQDLDGKHFKMKDFKPGITAPPFHCRCRSTTCPYFADEKGMRAARDKDGKYYTVPDDMDYGEWKETFVEDSMTPVDKKVYDKYSNFLGKNMPNVAKFQEIRYNQGDWKEFKAYASSIKIGELTALADFDLYQKVSKEIDETLIGTKTVNGVIVTGKSNHFIARVIGSVEQKRNGVSVSEVLKVITNSKDIRPIRHNKNGDSQVFVGENAAVSVNPQSGNLIQVNPMKGIKK